MRSKYHLTLISIAVLTLFSCRECLAEKYGEILLKNITLKSQRLVHYEIGVLSTGRRYVDIVTADNTIAEKQESWNGVAPLKKPIEQLVKQTIETIPNAYKLSEVRLVPCHFDSARFVAVVKFADPQRQDLPDGEDGEIRKWVFLDGNPLAETRLFLSEDEFQSLFEHSIPKLRKEEVNAGKREGSKRVKIK